jgi:hypothetical protein
MTRKRNANKDWYHFFQLGLFSIIIFFDNKNKLFQHIIDGLLVKLFCNYSFNFKASLD